MPPTHQLATCRKHCRHSASKFCLELNSPRSMWWGKMSLGALLRDERRSAEPSSRRSRGRQRMASLVSCMKMAWIRHSWCANPTGFLFSTAFDACAPQFQGRMNFCRNVHVEFCDVSLQIALHNCGFAFDTTRCVADSKPGLMPNFLVKSNSDP